MGGLLQARLFLTCTRGVFFFEGWGGGEERVCGTCFVAAH